MGMTGGITGGKTVFLCRDSFEGILCGVYDAWMSRLGHAHVALELEDTGNIEMFTEYRTVEVTEEKTEKVIGAIRRKGGDEVYEQVYCGCLSRDLQKADRIYRFLIYALHIGKRVVDMLQIPAVYDMFQMNRSVRNESHYLLEFLRFSKTQGDVLFGVVGPKHDVLVLLAPHFADRLRGENWIIYDEHRKKAVVHRAMGPWMVLQLADDAWKDRLMESSDQEQFENLWRTFHDHIAIAERINPVCQRNHLPLRFRPYMTEFQK